MERPAEIALKRIFSQTNTEICFNKRLFLCCDESRGNLYTLWYTWLVSCCFMTFYDAKWKFFLHRKLKTTQLETGVMTATQSYLLVFTFLV